MAETDPEVVLKNVRQKYPQYADQSDEQLKQALAKKYPAAYGYLARESTTRLIPMSAARPGIQGPIDLRPSSLLKSAPAAASTLAGFIPPLAPAAWAAKGAPLLARAGSRVLPFAERVVASEAAQRGTEKALGQPETPWWRGGGAQQTLGSMMAVPIKWAINAAGGRRAMAEFEAAQKAFEKAKTARTAEAKQQAERLADQMAVYREGVAGKYVAQARAAVPAFQAFPETMAGLDQMAGLEGQRALSERFKPYIEGVIQSGRGKSLLVRAEDAKELGLKAQKPRIQSSRPAIQAALGGPGAAPEGMVYVDAGAAAEAVTGTFQKKAVWESNPGLYDRVVRRLDEAGLTDKAASGEYRRGQAARRFLQEGKIIKTTEDGTPVLDLDAYQKALTVGGRPWKEVEQRRKVPIEPFRQVLGGRPREPIPMPEPTPPVEPEITRRRVPMPSSAFATGALAELPFALSGHHAYGAPFATGVALHELLGKGIVTQAPLTGAQQFATRVLPGLTGAAVKLPAEYLRSLGAQPPAEPQP